MDVSDRDALLVGIADLRSALFDAQENHKLPQRVHRFCDALVAWRSLPEPGRLYYGGQVVDSLFGLAADLEEDAEVPTLERTTIELSLWDVAVELRLIEADCDRAAFVSRRRARLLESLEKSAAGGVEKLLHRWAALLRPRVGPVPNLPGPFRDDAEAVVGELLTAGLPRRAKALAGKFQVPVDALVRWNIEHRPPSEEADRTKKLIQRLTAPPRPVSYQLLVYGRLLARVLSAPLDAIPMAVGSSGVISIGGDAYGAVHRRKSGSR